MEEAGRLYECTCLLRQRILHYLTPQYGPGIDWDTDFPAQQYLNHDVLIENITNQPMAQFRRSAFATIKSFLLLTGCQFSHRTVRPWDIFLQYLDGSDRRGFETLTSRIQLLVIVLNGDDPRREKNYPREIPWLIRKRHDQNLFTWVVSSIPLNEPLFEKRYAGLSEPLAACIEDSFVRLPFQPGSAG
jgi:hypothetical protein